MFAICGISNNQLGDNPAMLTGIIPASWSGHLLSALRVMTGLLFLQHGTAKLLKFPATEYFKDGDTVPSALCPIHHGSFKQRTARAIEGFFRGLGGKIAGIFRRK